MDADVEQPRESVERRTVDLFQKPFGMYCLK